uniref:Immunoglobulin V-set domain-containing protein n=1 Tax=Poecilia reticulata TaxID=8081 RepID=A0A3P9Q2J7_POERE
MLSLLSENNLILVVLHLYHFFLPSGVNCQQLTAGKIEEFSSEGSSAALTCSYTNKISAGDDFFWYLQNPGKPPEFIFHISGAPLPVEKGVFNVKVNSFSFAPSSPRSTASSS